MRLTQEDQRRLSEIFKRYHLEPGDEFPSNVQVSHDIGWMIGLLYRLDRTEIS